MRGGGPAPPDQPGGGGSPEPATFTAAAIFRRIVSSATGTLRGERAPPYFRITLKSSLRLLSADALVPAKGKEECMKAGNKRK